MNCPQCGWPGLIGSSLKKALAETENLNRLHKTQAERLRAELTAVHFLVEFGLRKSDAELRDVLTAWLRAGMPHPLAGSP